MSERDQTLMRTRCPECGTVFRVTSEQLRRKAGKVRCGQCQAVFNAFDEQLIDELTRLSADVEQTSITNSEALEHAKAELAAAETKGTALQSQCQAQEAELAKAIKLLRGIDRKMALARRYLQAQDQL